MPVDFSMRATIPEDALMQELDGETVFLNLATSRYYGMDKTGSRMWKALTSSESIQQAHEVLLAEYDVDPEVLRHDLAQLAEKLMETGLLVISSSSAPQTAS